MGVISLETDRLIIRNFSIDDSEDLHRMIVQYQASEAELVQAGWPAEELTEGEWPTLFRAVGCTACGRTGYRGRFALHEVMPITEEIERLVIERRSTEDIAKTAVMQGMLRLRDDGLRKAAAGQTSLEEIFRVVV